MSSAARSSEWRTCGGRGRRSVASSVAALVDQGARVGQRRVASAGRRDRSARARPGRSRIERSRARGPLPLPGTRQSTSGTTSLAASVGVAARTSATRSSSGWSGSWPIAETTGVRALATARSSPSSEKGRRSSTEPPPRAMTMTSTSGSASRRARAAITSPAERGPCMVACATSNRTAGQRRAARSRTSRSAADRGRGDQPDGAGQEGQALVCERWVEEALGREQLASALDLGEQLAEPDHPDLARLEGQGAAVGVVGRTWRARARSRPRPAAGSSSRSASASR